MGAVPLVDPAAAAAAALQRMPLPALLAWALELSLLVTHGKVGAEWPLAPLPWERRWASPGAPPLIRATTAGGGVVSTQLLPGFSPAHLSPPAAPCPGAVCRRARLQL